MSFITLLLYVEGFGLYSGIGGKEAPLYINENSQMSVYVLTVCNTDKSTWDVMVKDIKGDCSTEFRNTKAQKIDRFSYRLPGYVSEPIRGKDE